MIDEVVCFASSRIIWHDSFMCLFLFRQWNESMCFAFVMSSSRHELEDDIQHEQLLQKAHKVGQSWCARWREQRLT